MKTSHRLLITVVTLATITTTGCGRGSNEASGNTTRYCQLARTLAAPPTGINPATATPEQSMQAVKAHFASHLSEIDELERIAPAKVGPDVAVYARVARHIAQTGNLDEFDTPENAPAIARQEKFDEKACGIKPPSGP